MGIFDFFKPKKTSSKPSTTTVKSSQQKSANTLTVKVVGTEYRDQTQILSLGTLNSDYKLDKQNLIKKYHGDTIQYEYNFPAYKATFEFEPTNEYDPNAIKVLIQGIHVGYVKKGSCARIRNLINQNKILDISAEIRGGKSKNLYSTCGIGEKPTSKDYVLERNSDEFRITLTLKLFETQ